MVPIAYAALWVFIFCLPWENSVMISGLGAISKLMGILAMGIALLAVVVRGRFRRWRPFHVAALLFVAWSGCNLFFFHGTQNIPHKYDTYVQLVLVLWMMWELAPSRKAVLGLCSAYVLGSGVAAVSTILVARSEAGILHRFAAQGFDPNELAMTLALALPMAWYLGMTSPRPLMRWVYRGYLPVALLAIALTGSRGGLVASMVGLTIVPLTMTRLTPGRLAVAIALLAFSGGIAVAYAPQTVINRLATTRSEVQGGTLNGRLGIWKAGLTALLARPVTGHGVGGFQEAVQPILGEARVAHNSYISVLVEEGLVGFVLFMAMLFTVFRSILDLPTMDRRFALALYCTMGITMLPLSWESQKAVWFVLAALEGLARAQGPIDPGAAWRQRFRRVAVAPAAPRTARAREPLAGPVRRAGADGAA